LLRLRAAETPGVLAALAGLIGQGDGGSRC
jgi:hypothetical protein